MIKDTTEYHKEYKRKRRLLCIEILGGKCVKCGSSENLQFDHINPEEKIYEINQLLSYSKVILLEELAKCQLLCTECHKKKTRIYYNMVRNHGTLGGSKNCIPRCKPCKKVRAEYSRTRYKPKIC